MVDISKQERSKTESLILDRLVSVMQKHWNSSDDVKPSLGLYPEENTLLQSIFLKAYIPSAALGIGTFLFMKKVESNTLKTLIRRRDAAVASKKAATGQGETAANITHSHNSPFATPHSPKTSNHSTKEEIARYEETIKRFNSVSTSSFRFIGHFAASYVVWKISVALFVDKQRLVYLPLMEGRSKICDELCPPLLNEIAEVSQEFGEEGQSCLKEPNHSSLKNLLRFAENCQKRAAFERRLRKEQGLAENFPVAIPPPGVPESLDLDGETENIGSLFDARDQSSEQNWQDEFVRDDTEDDWRKP